VNDRFTAPFWEAAEAQRLVVARCAACGRMRMPPTPFCPQCRSQVLEWQLLSGRGKVFTYTIVWRAILPEMQDSIPYAPAVIDLEGAPGCRLVSNVVDVPVNRIVVGMPVQVVWDQVNGVTVPRFTGLRVEEGE
jgi:uncharacterized OB-fold protein